MRLFMMTVLAAFSLTAQANPATDFDILGHEEMVTLYPGDIRATARIDTGAARNSLYAIDEEVFTDDAGKEMIRFTFVDHNGDPHKMTRPLLDKIIITQASGQQTRYVVQMGLCVGDHYRETEFTLADRSHMTFPILVGRNYLKNDLLVSSSEKMIAKDECQVRLAKADLSKLNVVID